MKILYAAGNSHSSKIQLTRFLYNIDKSFNIKLSCFKKSIPDNVSVNWTLDNLLNMVKPELLSFDSDQFSIYYEQIKSFNPDLIISDLEYFTSHIANILNIPIWQCNSSIINFALLKKEKYNLGVFKTYASIFNRDQILHSKAVNIINNSNKNFIYSHFGDVINPPSILDNFKWIRPYHNVGKESIPCKHDIVAILPNNNKLIINDLKEYSDVVIFTKDYYEKYGNIINKNIDNNPEYICNLSNCYIFVCEGQTSFLADSFYNKKPSVIYKDLSNKESLINLALSERYNLSKENINLASSLDEIQLSINDEILFLHEEVENYFYKR